MFNLDLEKAEEPEIKLPSSVGSSKKQEFQRNIYFCLFTQESDDLTGAGARGCILAYFDSHTQLELWPASRPARRVDQVFREGLWGEYLRLPRGREGAHSVGRGLLAQELRGQRRSGGQGPGVQNNRKERP